jgi:hypothetical protein
MDIRRKLAIAVAAALAAAALALALPALAGAAKLKADYRFEGNFRSDAGNVPKLDKVGPGGEFVKKRVKGSRERVWRFPKGTGLRLEKAGLALGDDKGDYAFVMLVKLNDLKGYRKLIDFDNLQADAGLYVYYGSLLPYDLAESQPAILFGPWVQIVMTRNASGNVKGFVDGRRVVSVDDPGNTQVVGADSVLHFLLDDGGDEQSGGQIARLRIYDDALSARRVRDLRP